MAGREGLVAALCLTAAAAGAGDALPVKIREGVKNGIIARDAEAVEGRCVASDVSRMEGVAFEAPTPAIAPGAYEAALRIKLPVINHINTAPLKWTMAVRAGDRVLGQRDFDILTIESPGVYQEIPCRFVTAGGGRLLVALKWKREGLAQGQKGEMRVEPKDMPTAPSASLGEPERAPTTALELEAEIADEPPLGGLKYLYAAVDSVRLTPLGDIDVTEIGVDKIRYSPGERAEVSVRIHNFGPSPRDLRVETVFVQDMDRVIPVDERTVKIDARGDLAFTCRGPAFVEKWGYAVRCRAIEGDRVAAEKENYFTVHDNLWAVLIAGRGPAQFTAHVTRENAVQAAAANQRRYRNWVESGFWAPDEFGDFTPDTANWWGGQGCYYGGVEGTKMMIEEGHKRGIAFAVYSNIWGGDGLPAFEWVRRHPEWGYPSTYDTDWFERWNRNTMGRGREGIGMHVWPITIVNHTTEDPARWHARELIATHEMFGWDAVRYDSHAIADESARVVDIVKRVVRAKVPDFQFGYNSSVPQRNPKLAQAFKAQCEGEGGIMEEGIRQFGGGGMSYAGGASYESFARRLLDFKNEARENGGHFIAIGMDKAYPNDYVYQHILWLAGNAHPAYDWRELSVADYLQFATRFAGQLWDLNVTPLRDPEHRVDYGAGATNLWLWKEFVHERDLGAGRRQWILHLVNRPAAERLMAAEDCRLPPPRENIPVAVTIPDGAAVRNVWFLTPEYRLTQERLNARAEGKVLRFVVPRLRFWSTAVVEMDEVTGGR